jgi:hypothetical protein
MGDKELGGVMLPSSFGFGRCGLLENKVGGKVFPLTDGLVLILASLGSWALVDSFYRNS